MFITTKTLGDAVKRFSRIYYRKKVTYLFTWQTNYQFWKYSIKEYITCRTWRCINFFSAFFFLFLMQGREGKGHFLHFYLFKPFMKINTSTISDKNYGKNCYLNNSVFLSLSTLKNVEEQWAKLASSNAIGSQHCIGGEGKFWTHFLKFP